MEQQMLFEEKDLIILITQNLKSKRLKVKTIRFDKTYPTEHEISQVFAKVTAEIER